MDVPAGLTSRPLQLDDSRAVFEVMAAQEQHDTGEVTIEESDIVADWGVPGFDVGASTLGVFDDDELLVAYAEVGQGGRGDAAVHPDHRGRGLGSALARWMQATAREQGLTLVAMPVPRGSDGDRLLTALGYRDRWDSWMLQLPAGTRVPDRPLPEGYAVRASRPEDYEQVWTVKEDAFLEWAARDRETYETWHALVVARPGFEPWHLRVMTDPGGFVVAVAVLQTAGTIAFVSQLAVRKDLRGRGLGQALLVDAFAAGLEHGADRFELSTDSRTGALGLYEKVGMVVTSTWVNKAIDLQPGG